MNISPASPIAAVAVAETNFNRAAARISAPESPIDTATLSSAVVDLLQAKNQFKTSLSVVRITNEMQKTTLSLLA